MTGVQTCALPIYGELTPRAYDVTTMIGTFLRTPVTRVVEPTARALLARKVSANQVTIVGALGTIGISLLCFTRGQLFVGTLAMLIFIFSDLVDGTMARISGTTSKFGAFLDSTSDRIVDAALIGSVTYFLYRESDPLHVVAWFALAGGFLVSYVKARAEASGFTCEGGFAERAERTIILLVSTGFAGLGIPYILAIGMWILAIASFLTAAFRIHQVWKQR